MHIEALRDYCLSLPQVTEDFPFDESTLVFRVGGKIFLLTDIDEGKSFNAKCNNCLYFKRKRSFFYGK